MDICTIKGCDNWGHARGYCEKHYRRLLTHGDPNITKWAREKRGPVCTAEGCNIKHHAKGYCRIHYERIERNGHLMNINKESHMKTKIPEYGVWAGMKQRCNNPNSKDYKYYGGRGITICDRWLNSFAAFFKDMGTRTTSKHQIDRTNNNGNYEPDNCHWVTPKENTNNRRNTKKIGDTYGR